jgi:hypothetical protein
MMHFDGEDNSVLFTDSSTNNLSISVNGDTIMSTGIYKFGTSSAYFDGDGDYLIVANTSGVLDLNSDDFTIEFWFNTDGSGPLQQYNSLVGTFTNINSDGFRLSVSQNGVILYNSLGDVFTLTNTNYCDQEWHHIALVREINYISCFIDGILAISHDVGTEYTFTPNYDLLIGGQTYDNLFYTGYIDELRIMKTAVYKLSNGNFIPPSGAFI